MAYKCNGGMSGAQEGAYLRSVWRAAAGGGMGDAGDRHLALMEKRQGDGFTLRRMRTSGMGFLPEIFGVATSFLKDKQSADAAEEARKTAEANARAAKYQAQAAAADSGGDSTRTRNLVLGGAAVVLTGVLAWSILRRRGRGG